MPPPSAPGASATGSYDLAPLSWVLPDLRKSLPMATSAVREFLLATEGPDADAQAHLHRLHDARRLFHQAGSALEMIGQSEAAKMLSACANLVRACVETPAQCTPEAVSALEKTHLALSDYLELLLKRGQAPALCLFPQYRDLLAGVGQVRIHPADLWIRPWKWIQPNLPAGVAALKPNARLKAQLDQALLRLLHSGDSAAAAELAKKCAGLSAGGATLEARGLWFLAAALFEACALQCLPMDVYLKRTASQLLQQLGHGPADVTEASERVAQDAAFFCLQVPAQALRSTLYLPALQQAYAWMEPPQGDYRHVYFGRFDPVHLEFLRRRLAALSESWSGFAAGDLSRAQAALEHVGAVAEVLLKLHPQGASLVQVLSQAVGAPIASAAKPDAQLAMEVATTLLYLEAVYDDLSAADDEVTQRMAVLASRLGQVAAGQAPDPVEPWMEALYRRLSERQSMDSVTSELRVALGAVELALEKYLRDPLDTSILALVSGHLSQMYGVFSVLGLHQASSAVMSIREYLDAHLQTSKRGRPIPLPAYERIARCVSNMGFLIDMLGYQISFAKEMFVFDAPTGEFNYLNGRRGGVKRIEVPKLGSKVAARPIAASAPGLATTPAPNQHSTNQPVQPQGPAMPPPAVQTPIVEPPPDDEDDGAEILDIFLDEAASVLEDAQLALTAVSLDAQQFDALIVVRRAFHTLKGGARMVGLEEFAEAAWSFEQLMNQWLAQQQAPSAELLGLIAQALTAFSDWVHCIGTAKPAHWNAPTFRAAADAMRIEGRWVQLRAPSTEPVAGDPAQFELAPEAYATETFVDTSLEESAAAAPFLFDALDERLPAPPASPAWHRPPEDVEPLPMQAGLSPANAPWHDEELPRTEDAPPQDAPPGFTDAVFAVFLSETRDWALRLVQELAGWDETVPPARRRVAQDLAHSIRGNAAAVGIGALAQLAQGLEEALDKVQLGESVPLGQVQVFQAVGEALLTILQACGPDTVVPAQDHWLTELALMQTGPQASWPQAPGLRAADFETLPAQDRDAAVLQAQVDLVPEASDALALEPPSQAAAGPIAKPAPRHDSAHFEPATAASLDFLDAQEQFDSEDQLDFDLLPVFQEEGAEIMRALGKALRQWFDQPQDAAARAQILRLLHTLKGSGRLTGAFRLGELAHRMESGIEALPQQIHHAAQIEPFLLRLDALQRLFDALDAAVATELAPNAAQEVATLAPTAAALEMPKLRIIEGARALPISRTGLIRVKAGVVERLVDQAGEVSVYRSRTEAHLAQMGSSLGELGQTLDRLSSQLRELELQADMRIQSRNSAATVVGEQFDPLEFDRFTRLQEISRMLAEAVGDVATVRRTVQTALSASQQDLEQQGRQMRELQRDLLRMRLVDFDVVADRLYGVVRQTAKELGKQVNLDLEGGEIELDRSVLERMTPAFEHLLRNAVVHGIETPADREAAGKPGVGLIKVQLTQDGNDIAIAISDDGRGLSPEKIRQKAQAMGLLRPDQAIDTPSLMHLLFTPGFSTASAVTELAGRGIGLDVVLSEVNALGGRIDTDSQVGEGTRFKLTLPLTTAVTQVLIVRVGATRIGVPSGLVETVLRTPAEQLQVAYRQGQLTAERGPGTQFHGAGALLHLPQDPLDVKNTTYPTLVLRSAGQRMAFHVDEVLGNREVVVKNMGPQLSRLPGLTGITVLPSGEALLIYNLIALAAVYGVQTDKARTSGAYGLPATAELGVQEAPLILVVDDAITVRRVIQRLLLREGYRVALANDGVQALQILEKQKPLMVLSDIEMPRMDGFELARSIRARPDYADLPIVMITSRIAQKHRDHAMALGVNHYLGKPYSEVELLGLIRQQSARVRAA